MAPKATNAHRKAVAAAIAAGVLLSYRGKKRQVLDGLGAIGAAATVSQAAQTKIDAFAVERAQQWQNGTNNHIDAALNQLPSDATPQQHAGQLAQEKAQQSAYIETALVPSLVSWGSHQALIDTYEELPADDSGGTLAQATQWEWTQNTENPDDCMDAEAASPASLEDLLGIAGGPPPTHVNCQCDLSPLGADADSIAYAMRQLGVSDALNPIGEAANLLQGMDVKVTTSFPDRPRQVPT